MTQQAIVLHPVNPKTGDNSGHSAPSPPSSGPLALTEAKPQPAQTWPFSCVEAVQETLTIPAPVYFSPPSPLAELARFLTIGRSYHARCRHHFVEEVHVGYYAYERRSEWRTCALAAAYAGAFGPQAIERSEFSYTQAIWQLSKRVGYALDQLMVVGPTGRVSAVCDEMILLIDTNFWSRAAIAEWLPTARVVAQSGGGLP